MLVWAIPQNMSFDIPMPPDKVLWIVGVEVAIVILLLVASLLYDREDLKKRYKIPKIKHPEPLTALQYFAKMAGLPPLPVLKRPCHDCAVECGFYLDPANSLKSLNDEEVKRGAVNSWFCHNHTNRACKGVANHVFGKNE